MDIIAQNANNTQGEQMEAQREADSYINMSGDGIEVEEPQID